MHVEGFVLEQLAIPEDLEDSEEEVELWVISEEAFAPEGSDWECLPSMLT